MKEYKKIHFIGIGGIGMSGLARLFKHEGVQVSGSDTTETENTKKLETEGIIISYKQDGSRTIDDKTDLVVYTEAVSYDNPELVNARESGVRVISYFEALGEVANEYYLIAVAGTHGKTTTTAMLIDILEEASFDPSAIVGSLRSKTGSNYRAGKSKYFIVEACEYKRDFLTLNPDILVITNIEHEHVDYYKDLCDVQDAFHEFAMKVPEDGLIITAASDIAIVPVLSGVSARVIDYKIEVLNTLQLKQPGLHNRMNAGAARATALSLGIEKRIINESLENFAGTQRRFEYKGDCNGAPVYDDYAHHPTEIEATIAGVREMYSGKKITIIFQPHTYSRTQELYDTFVSALSKSDKVIMVPIYAAREENDSSVDSVQITDSLNSMGVESLYFHTLEAAALSVKESVNMDDVVVIMGAGDVTKVADNLTDKGI